MFKNTYFTSEAVSCGHPDKICDQISDAILDAYLAFDPNAKVAVECFITDNLLVIGGEVNSTAHIDAVQIARNVIERIGYHKGIGFDPEGASIVDAIHAQSPDIRMGVDGQGQLQEQGAGDQGIMFGYACNDTKVYMPAPILLANTTMKVYDIERKFATGLRPDAKCQYTLKYDENGRPESIKTILFSAQHDPLLEASDVRRFFIDKVLPEVKKFLPELSYLFESDFDIKVNPTGKFIIGGPEGDTGLTGRKIIVDTYGGACPHGGGAFSGKDASKVDRSAAYAARYIAKNLVAAGVADEITVQLSYAIGLADPLSVHVDAVGNKIPTNKMEDLIMEIFPLRPYDIINHFSLKKPIFAKTSVYGHFGNEDYPWERLDMVKEIKKLHLL